MAKHEVGDRLVEDLGGRLGTYSAGRIAGMYESPSKKGTIYMLLISDKGRFTVYAAIETQQSRPWVPREIPSDVFKQISETCLAGVELPPEKECSKPPPPAPKKRTQEEEPSPSVAEEPAAAESSAVEPEAAESTVVESDGRLIPGLDILIEVAS